MQRAFLATVFRQADRHQFPVRGWHEPIDGHMTHGLQFVGIEHDLFRAEVVDRSQGDQQPLLPGRLELEGEETTWPRNKAAESRRELGEHGGQLRKHLRPVCDPIEMIPRPAVLRIRPRFDGRIIPRLQPTMFIHHHHTMILVADRTIADGGLWDGSLEYRGGGHD